MSKFADCFSQKINTLSHSERYIFYHIDKHPEKCSASSLTELAALTNTSTTSVIRLCKKIGLSGFSELKFALKNMLNQNTVSDSNPLLQYKAAMESMIFANNDHEVEEMSHRLTHSQKVFVVAVGLSKSVGEYMTQLLTQKNIVSLLFVDSHLIELLPQMATAQDLILFISSSGETTTLVSSAKKLSALNIPIISLTNKTDCTLGKYSKHIWGTNLTHISACGFDATPRSALMAMVDVLMLKNAK